MACCVSVDAQQMLVFKKSRNRLAYYEKGDVISYRLKGDRTKLTGHIEGFDGGKILFRYHTVDPSEISHIYVDEKTRIWFAFRYKYERLLLIAGAGYLLLDTFNTGELTKETKVISASLVGAGLLARFLIIDRFRIRGQKKLRIIDI